MADEKADTGTGEIGTDALDDVAGGAVDAFLKIDGVKGESSNSVTESFNKSVSVTDTFYKLDPQG